MYPTLWIDLLIGIIFMLMPIMLQAFWYKIKLWKTIPIVLMIAVAGIIGTSSMYFIENGKFGGISFYGAVFFVPVVFIFVAWLLRIPYGQVMDLCAPAGCVMLVIMKWGCFLTNCCAGRVLYFDAQGNAVVFPSQIAELITALILGAVLLLLCYRKKQKGFIYPWFLLLYGSTRFILNFFRNVWEHHRLPMGTIWSIVSVALGLFCLFVFRRRKSSEKQKNISP